MAFIANVYNCMDIDIGPVVNNLMVKKRKLYLYKRFKMNKTDETITTGVNNEYEINATNQTSIIKFPSQIKSELTVVDEQTMSNDTSLYCKRTVNPCNMCGSITCKYPKQQKKQQQQQHHGIFTAKNRHTYCNMSKAKQMNCSCKHNCRRKSLSYELSQIETSTEADEQHQERNSPWNHPCSGVTANKTNFMQPAPQTFHYSTCPLLSSRTSSPLTLLSRPLSIECGSKENHSLQIKHKKPFGHDLSSSSKSTLKKIIFLDERQNITTTCSQFRINALSEMLKHLNSSIISLACFGFNQKFAKQKLLKVDTKCYHLQRPRRKRSPATLGTQILHQRLTNATILNMVLMGLWFLALLSPSTHALASLETSLQTSPVAFTARSETTSPPVRLSRTETVCKSLDIRNTPGEFRQLENCTVIEGFLLITLVTTHTTSEFTETYPLLTEVTEFIIVYQIENLRSLAQIFPNLSVIRGRNLFEGYALIVYSNMHLEELGLSKLTTISRGGVRIEKNVMLCFVKTIDWSQIVSNTTDIVIEDNRDTIECPLCPGDQKSSVSDNTLNELICKEHHGSRNCWNSNTCQKICPERCRHNCLDENTCCNDSCLGGCSSDNFNECIICRNFSIYNNTCIDKCPENYYSYLDRRCLTAESCSRIGTKYENNKPETLVPYKGRCSTRCPEGYSKINLTCTECGDKCLKKCVGGQIDSVARAKEYHGCTHIIDEGLTIVIKRGGRHLIEDLEYSLASIEVITTYLKVQGTYGMLNLRFFKNLKTIKGERLVEDKYAFYVLENTDMESIWATNQTVRIEAGTVYFHFNPKLCLTEIETLLPMLKNQTKFDKNEVSEDSNGSRGSCNTTFLNVTLTTINSQFAIVEILNPMKFEDERTFIGYQYLHIEDNFGNATKHGFRPCDDGWTISLPTKETRYFFLNLNPFTQYAYYVKTMTISTERRNAQSPVQRFITKSDQPKFVNKLQAYPNSSSEIVMTWLPPTSANGQLKMYKIRAVLVRIQNSESRNYCKDPLKEIKIENPKIESPRTEKPPISEGCKCPKPKDSVYDDENADANIHASIELENTLQNFIYVKKTDSVPIENAVTVESNESDMTKRRRRNIEGTPNDSFLLRHIRDIPIDEYDRAVRSALVEPKQEKHNMPSNITRKDEDGLYYEVIAASVNATTTDYVFKSLKHFSWYMIGVKACREPEEGASPNECSMEVKILARTLMLDDVDKVEKLRADLEPTNSSRSSIRLFWERPARPNGAVVSYTIMYELQTQDAVEEKKCITEVDYTELDYQHNGYVLTGLFTGNYSIRIRTNSMAGEGKFSRTIYIYIPPTTPSPALIAGICVALLTLLSLIGGTIYFLVRKRFLTPPSDLKMFPTVNPYYISLQYIPDEWEVARDRVIQLNPLGQGSFGMVYEGILKGYNNSAEDTPCAVKTVNENATDRERMNFLNEASVMKQFDTYHVVRLLGVCSRGQPALVIMELMKNGDLKSYLRAHRPDERDEFGMTLAERGLSSQPPPLSRIYQMAIEIADGMAYLSAKKFVHRDLAARNCMVAADLTVKIGDFGMTRDIYETDYYRKGTKGLLPVRWMPPESLRDGVYSSASDVFSYGVVLWEMSTLASQPYQGLSNDQVLRYVIEGGVMERPENCPDKLYSLMQKCWHHRPTARPTFMEIIRYLADLADPHFREVSFYHSEEGQQVLAKEVAERNQRSGDVFEEPENDMEDVTTPLRMEEYGGFQLAEENDSSGENQVESPITMNIEPPHSPCSLGSAIVVSSTPDVQSKNSLILSQNLHHNQGLSSLPSTSSGLARVNSQLQSHIQPHQRQLYPPSQRRFLHGIVRGTVDDVDAYVQPDYEETEERGRIGTDERGYELYDPSPNYRQQVSCHAGDDEEDNFAIPSAGQNLLLGSRERQILPRIMPLSSSVPDDVIGQPTASSLHPSTASAASSNTSSKATTTGKYSNLKAVADSLGNSLMPTLLRKNIRFFNHKRSGSNVSHNSSSSNPCAPISGAGDGSSSNLTRGGRGKSMSGQNLGTIESGGSGSAGSFCSNPRFFTPAASISENPNYRRLNESSSVEGGGDASKLKPKLPSTSTFTISSNPNYQILDESLNSSGTSSANPNYQLQTCPITTTSQSSENANYVIMSEPQQNEDIGNTVNVSENPNYQMMGPSLLLATTATEMQATQLERDRLDKFSCSPSSSSSPHESEEDFETTDGMKMDRIPLSRRSSNSQSQHKRNSDRSRSSSGHSHATTPTNTPSTSTGGHGTQLRLIPTSTFSLKEKWLKQQQQQQSSPPPPPNGFVGREA
ncbi:insulin-like receptor isoform 1-T9 [Glossina fuscipes fuscipes]